MYVRLVRVLRLFCMVGENYDHHCLASLLHEKTEAFACSAFDIP